MILSSFVFSHFGPTHRLLFMRYRGIEIAVRGFRGGENVKHLAVRPRHQLARSRCVTDGFLRASNGWIGAIQMQERSCLVRSSERILSRTNDNAVLDLFHTRSETPEEKIGSRPEQSRFHHRGILLQDPLAILDRGFVMMLLNKYFSTDVERWPITRVCLNRGIHALQSTGRIAFFEELILCLVGQFDRIHVATAANFHFNRPRPHRSEVEKNRDD